MKWLDTEVKVLRATLLLAALTALFAGGWALFTYIYPPSQPLTLSVKENATPAEQIAAQAVPLTLCYGEYYNICVSKFPDIVFDGHIPCHQTEIRLKALCSSYTEPKQTPPRGISGNGCGYAFLTLKCVKK